MTLRAVSQGAVQNITPSLILNDASAATINTTILNALAASLSNISTSKIRILFPDGDVYYNGVINWRSYQNTNVSITTGVVPLESEWPEMDSAGTTTFRWSGGQVNGATWTFQQGTAGTQATNLRLKNLRWAGPGVSVVSPTVATSPVGAAATSVQVSSTTGVAIGNAIAISADSLPNGVTSPPWWATITNVVGSTVTFAPATPNNFNAAVGNVCQVFVQNRAIQIGGLNSSIQDVNFYVKIDRCAFIDWLSASAFNDTTGLTITGNTTYAYCMFGAEYGYNVDVSRWEQPQMICQLVSITGNTTSGSKVITGIVGGTAQLKVGMSLGDITAVATAQAFPEWSVIQSIDSSTQVTMTHPATLTGSRTLQPVMGWLFTQGSGGSPFYPLQSIGNGNRSNDDVVNLNGAILNQTSGFFKTDSNTNSAVCAEDSYVELCQRIALIGNQGGVNSSGPYVFRRVILSDSTKFTGAPIESFGGGVNVEYVDVQGAGNLSFPFYRNAVSSTNVGITYARNNIPLAANVYQILPNQYYFNGITPGTSDQGTLSIKGVGNSNLINTNSSVTGTLNQEVGGWDGFNWTLTGNATLSIPSSDIPPAGKRLRFVVNNGAGNITLTLPTSPFPFVNQAGTNITTITVNASPSKICVMDFISTGSKLMLVGGTLSAGAPVFV